MVVNADETFLNAAGSMHKAKCIESKIKNKKSSIDLKRLKSAAFIPFVTPTHIIMSVFIIPVEKYGEVKFTINKVPQSSRSTHTIYYIFNQTGWLNSDAWLSILDVFRERNQN